MSKTFVKLDGILLDFVEQVVLRYVKKSGYKKHKRNFAELLSRYNTAFFAMFVVVVPTIVFSFSMKLGFIAAIIHGTIWSLALMFEARQYMSSLDEMQQYDIIFMNRKNPKIYKAVKELCDLMRNDKMLKAIRVEYLKSTRWYIIAIFVIGFISFLAVPTWSDLMFLALLIHNIVKTLDMYIEPVFDFDEPKKKKKKVKASLTEIVSKKIERLVSSFKPATAPSGA